MALRTIVTTHPTRLRLAALSAAPFLLALIVHLFTYTLLYDRLPESLATHFTASGTPDGYTSREATAFVSSGVLLVLGAAWGWTVIASTHTLTTLGARARVAVGWGMAAFMGYGLTALVVANSGPPSGSEVRFPGLQFLVALGCGPLAAAAGALMARALAGSIPVGPSGPASGAPTGGTRDRIDLAEGEVASWARQLTPWPILLSGAALPVGSVVLGLVSAWLVFAPLGLFGLLTLAVGSAYVAVDHRGLTFLPALLPWPAVRIPLSGITEASTRRISPPADFGGWGYRVRPLRTGLVTRSGEALVVRRKSGREFVVTVDDAATGAALLATLLDRRESN